MRALSLHAELLLLSHDPATCRPYKTPRKRRHAAFGAAIVQEGGRRPRTAWGLRRMGRRAEEAALDELRATGVVKGSKLIDRAALARRYDALLARMAARSFSRERDGVLVTLLAYADVLEPRLRGRDHRWFADVMRAAIDPDQPTRAVEALALEHHRDGYELLVFLIDEAKDLWPGLRAKDTSHVQAQETQGVRSV